MRRTALLLLGLCGVRCGDARILSWQILFREDQVRQETALVRATMTRGSCESEDVIYEAVADRNDAAGLRQPPELGTGTYSFKGVALDASCRVLGDGCVTTELPRPSGTIVTVWIRRLEGARPCLAALCGPDACEGTECDEGFADCNDNLDDGCEASLESTASCGDCETRCEPPTPVCASDAEGSRCVGSCEDLGLTDCGGSCVDLATDVQHCGACDAVCAPEHATGRCVASTCEIEECDPRWGDCNDQDPDGCETSLASASDCGDCDVRCEGATPVCVDAGTLACGASCSDADLTDCGGSCVDTTTDLEHCGGCGDACSDLPHASAECVGGVCGLGTCNPGWRDCNTTDGDGCEVDLNSDTDCGDCGVACDFSYATASCHSGSCEIDSCDPNRGDCDGIVSTGCETNLDYSETHCGACNAPCVLGANVNQMQCNRGDCEIDRCNNGWGDCNGVVGDGCEQADSTSNCCGVNCDGLPNVASTRCDRGDCETVTCDPGWQICGEEEENSSDGCECAA